MLVINPFPCAVTQTLGVSTFCSPPKGGWELMLLKLFKAQKTKNNRNCVCLRPQGAFQFILYLQIWPTITQWFLTLICLIYWFPAVRAQLCSTQVLWLRHEHLTGDTQSSNLLALQELCCVHRRRWGEGQTDLGIKLSGPVMYEACAVFFLVAVWCIYIRIHLTRGMQTKNRNYFPNWRWRFLGFPR